MNEIETIGVAVGLLLILVETTVLFRMQSHMRTLEGLTKRLDSHITHMDKHIDLMDERVVKIKKEISLVCEHVGVASKD
jgi:uncharacterized membrane-anchored protein YhcB (DUF1043 family)